MREVPGAARSLLETESVACLVGPAVRHKLERLRGAIPEAYVGDEAPPIGEMHQEDHMITHLLWQEWILADTGRVKRA